MSTKKKGDRTQRITLTVCIQMGARIREPAETSRGMTTDLTFQRAAEDSGKLAAPIFSLPPPFFFGLLSLQAGCGGDAAGFTLKEHVKRSWLGRRTGKLERKQESDY